MNTTDDPGDGPAGRALSASDQQVDTQRASRFAGVLMAVVMLALATGVITLEFGFYKAFDDNWLKMDASAASSALALLGLIGSDGDANTSSRATAAPAK